MELKSVKNMVADVAKENATLRLIAKQGDCGTRFLHIAIARDGERLFVSQDTGVVFNVRRPDQASAMFAGTVETDGTVTVPLRAWALELAGRLECDVSLIASGDKKLTTGTFFVEVEASSCPEENMIEEEEYSVLLNLIASVESGEAERCAAEQIRSANESARDAAEGLRAQAEALRNAAESGREEEAAALLERLEDAAEQYEGGLSHTHLSEDIVDLDIPVSLADLEQDAQHRTVTDAEKQSWNAATSGSSENLLSQLLSCVYPVGSIYLSVNETSPVIFLGGQWERISDRFLLASGSSYAAGSTGGSALHNHDYKLSFANYNLGFDTSADGLGAYNYDSKSYVKARVAGGVSAKGLYNVSVETHTLSVSYLDGGNTSYKENLPPYLAVYAWKRVA